MPVSPFPAIPRISQSESDFDENADQFAAHLPTFINQLNALSGQSTYQLWLDQGNSGSANDYLASLRVNAVKTLYVDNSVNSGGPGTSASPMSSIEEAIASIVDFSQTIIYLRRGQTHEIGSAGLPPATVNPATYHLANVQITFESYGSGTQPLVKVNYFDHTNGSSYPAIVLFTKGFSSLAFGVDYEINESALYPPVGFHSSLIWPAQGCFLLVSLHNSTVKIPGSAPYAHNIVSTYAWSAKTTIMIESCTITGGGDVINSFFNPLIDLNVYGGSIAVDTYYCSNALAGNINIHTNYTGAQLKRA